MILYAWVNDEDTKRAYESSDDAYRVFRKMLDRGQPPDDRDQRGAEARATRTQLCNERALLQISTYESYIERRIFKYRYLSGV